MQFIQNVSKDAVRQGHHFDPGFNSLLICINDPGSKWVVPRFPFLQIERFEFLDVEDVDTWCDPELMPQPEHAKRLVEVLQRALQNHQNVVVHCTAGICRSGAVVEVGTMMGFDDTETWRSPNLRLKHLMMQELGLSFDPHETHRLKLGGEPDWLDPRGELTGI